MLSFAPAPRLRPSRLGRRVQLHRKIDQAGDGGGRRLKSARHELHVAGRRSQHPSFNFRDFGLAKAHESSQRLAGQAPFPPHTGEVTTQRPEHAFAVGLAASVRAVGHRFGHLAGRRQELFTLSPHAPASPRRRPVPRAHPGCRRIFAPLAIRRVPTHLWPTSRVVHLSAQVGQDWPTTSPA